MSDDELAAIAARPEILNIPDGEGAPADDPETVTEGSSAGADAREGDPMIGLLLSELVDAIAGAITSRYRVSELTAEESATIGMAGATVLAQYDIAKLSPRSAAWLGLGIAVAGVAIPRVRQYRETIDLEPDADPAAEPGPELRVVDPDDGDKDG